MIDQIDQEQIKDVTERYKMAAFTGSSDVVLQEAAEQDDWFAWFMEFTDAKHKSLGRKGRLPRLIGLTSLREVYLMIVLKLAEMETP